MSSWPSSKARRVFAALRRIGWHHDRTVGSHKIMKKDGWADYPERPKSACYNEAKIS
jgi:predicted RNA binding protein YcfA (HicA-like mRNA interferase family)